MTARLVVTCAISLAAGVAGSVQTGVQADVAPQNVMEQVKATLPKGWKCRTEGTALVARPNEEFVFVNMIGAEAPRKGESKDAYRRRHRVTIDYKIALRFAPKLAAREVQALVAANETIQAKLHAIEQDPLVTPMKGDFWFAKTAQGRTLSRQYEELKRSLKPVPYGHCGSVSVYIEPTCLGYARFLDRGDKAASEAVLKDLRALFTRYDADAPNKRP
jgi:hypothetical protein